MNTGKSKNPGVVWRGRSPSKCNPQQRPVRCEEHFCEAEHALREQKCFPCAFSARESRRDERKRRFMSIKWRIHLIEGAVQQPLMIDQAWISVRGSTASMSTKTGLPLSRSIYTGASSAVSRPVGSKYRYRLKHT